MNLCKDCIHKSDHSGEHLRYWTCLKYPWEEINFLDPDKRINPPYKYCRDINKDGNCSDFERHENGT